ncbi:MAG TPA: site-specific DNA-methyltransferase [Steroidobacteraceae bacterium]|jgi:DNA modification methylase
MTIQLITGDCREVLPTLPDASVQCVVTSVPYYGLRDYGTARWEGGDATCGHRGGPQQSAASTLAGNGHGNGKPLSPSLQAQTTPYRSVCGKCGARRVDAQIGLEATPELWITEMVAVFRELRRVLRDDGCIFCNVGDSYQDKQLLMMPARLAIALQQDGWWLRSQLPWLKRSCMPESAKDRPTSAIEYVFMLTKSARYFWDAGAVKRVSAASSIDRLAQDVASQKGSNRANGGRKTNGPMRATGGSARNFRNSDLFFDSLEPPYGLICDADGMPLALDVNPAAYSGAHFATFSPKLIEPLIRAGTSERGCCAQCGAPWVRTTDKTFVPTQDPMSLKAGDKGIALGGWERPRGVNDATTTGWAPSCGCVSFRCVTCSFVLDTNHENREASTKQIVPDMRGGVQAVGAAEPVLQPSLLRTAGEEAKANSVPSMREGLHAAELPAETMFGPVRASMDSGSPGFDEGLDDNLKGLQATAKAGPSERDRLWLCDGASAGDGEEARQASHPERGGSPQEWEQAGQPSSQSGVNGKARSRRIAKASLHCDMPTLPEGLSDERQCPDCGSRLERTAPATSPCVVLDCFSGAGTTALVADRLGRHAIGIDLSHAYMEMTRERLTADCPLFTDLAAPVPEHPVETELADLFSYAAD